MGTTPNKHTTTIYIDPDVWAAVRMLAIQRGTSASQIMEDLARTWLTKEEKTEASSAVA